MDAPVVPVVLMMAGGYLAWFGIHYWRSDTKWPTDPVKAILTGQGLPPVTHTGEQQDKTVIQGVVSSLASSGSAVQPASVPGSLYPHGNTVGAAAAAQKYIGQGYVWGGNADRPGNWDCSSFCSYVLGHDLGLPLPGGHWGDLGFPPHSHGPTTGSYALYGTPINASQVQQGDLVVWSTHMGIAVSPTSIVSARDPKDGVGIDTIASMTSSLHESVLYRRP